MLIHGAPAAGDQNFWNALGIPEDMRGGIVEAAGTVELWPEHEAGFYLFSALQTQWRVGMCGPTGLDYAAMPVTAQGMQIDLTPDVFEQVRVMEAEALRLFAEKRDRA